MFISLNQIQASLQQLASIHPFFGMPFLAFKENNLPVDDVAEFTFSARVEKILQEYFRPTETFEGFFNPFFTSKPSARWVRPRYGSTTLQRITADTFADSLIHTKGTSYWGWQPDYISKLKAHLNGERIPAIDLAVWLFRCRKWDEPSLTCVRDLFFNVFNITSEEKEVLFDTELPPNSTQSFVNELFTQEDLLAVLGSPPGSKPEEGAALQFLELSHVGPATHFVYEPNSRMNLLTGDNSLGKTFLLECIWWALTDQWCDYPAMPRTDVPKKNPKIQFRFLLRHERGVTTSANYDWERQCWVKPRSEKTIPGLVIYARYDGSFSVWDPARASLSGSQARDGSLFMDSKEVWNGVIREDSQRQRWACNGLIRDWVAWQTGGKRYADKYEAFVRCLDTLSPSESERLRPGEPTRFPLDAREMPTLSLPYGDVPLELASAAIRRVVALAYLLVWSWYEHLANSSIIRQKPQRKLVVLVDEVEAHLHPRWQRAIVPALLDVLSGLVDEIRPQLHLATHSPMVMASAEPQYDESVDRLHHLKLDGTDVLLEPLPFVKRGPADLWLMSNVFGLTHARSIPAERALEAAKKLQETGCQNFEEVKNLHNELCELLAPDDEFWPRWLFFAEQRGVKV